MYKKINKFIILYTLCFIFIIVSISIAKMAYWQESMTDEGWKEGGEEAESLTPWQALDKEISGSLSGLVKEVNIPLGIVVVNHSASSLVS